MASYSSDGRSSTETEVGPLLTPTLESARVSDRSAVSDSSHRSLIQQHSHFYCLTRSAAADSGSARGGELSRGEGLGGVRRGLLPLPTRPLLHVGPGKEGGAL